MFSMFGRKSRSSPWMDYEDDVASDSSSSQPSIIVEGRQPSVFLKCLVFVGYVVLQAVDRIFMKRVTNSMHSPTYNLMLWNIIWPVTMQFFNLAYMLPYIWLMRRRGHKEYTRGFLLPGNPAATSTGPISVLQLGLFSLGSQLCTCLGGPSVAFISVAMMSVMANTNTIFVLFLSAIFLRTRFKAVHYASCILVVVSVLVGVSSKLSRHDCSEAGMQKGNCLFAYKGSDGTFHELSFAEYLLWYGLYLFSYLPLAAGYVYQQHVLQLRQVEIVYGTWWSGLFQIPWGLLCIPLFWIKLPGQEQLPADQTLTGLLDTLSCMCGYIQHPGDEACATSPPPIFWYVIYLAFNVSWVVLRLWLTKYLSALWTAVATVLCMDLTNIFGMIPFLAGGGAQTMSLNDWLATILASVALWIYSLEPEERGRRSKAEQGTEDEQE